jgi:hypothetical protein
LDPEFAQAAFYYARSTTQFPHRDAGPAAPAVGLAKQAGDRERLVIAELGVAMLSPALLAWPNPDGPLP